MKHATLILTLGAMAAASFPACVGGGEAQRAPPDRDLGEGGATAFERDLAFLREHDPDLVVLRSGDAALAASARYQGKVFTSTTGGGESQGYIAYGAFAVDPPAARINAYGGEQRLWVGPEGGPLSVFFPADVPFAHEYWRTPAPIDREPWELASAGEREVSFRKTARFASRAGATFDARLDRRVELLDATELRERLGGEVVDELAGVGYVTANALTNVGAEPWTEQTGAPCLWALDMLPAGDSVVVVLPYRGATPATLDTTNAGYFGATPPERLRVVEGAVLFRGDGEEVGKVGLPPRRATGRLGAVDLERGVLTVVDFGLDPRARYLGMEWAEADDPYAGDAATSYNHDNRPAGASFFELESVGPAAFLAPGETSAHRHAVYHLAGPRHAVMSATRRLLGPDSSALVSFLREAN